MAIHIETPLFLLGIFFLISFLPFFHLFFIFLIMNIKEWYDKLFNK